MRGTLTVAEIRAQVEAARKIALDRFQADWGTRDVRTVASALATTIPNSASPADAARKARALLP